MFSAGKNSGSPQNPSIRSIRSQTEKLYNLAIEAAGLTGKELVVDAYCGIGTIGIVAASAAKEVIGVELNKDAVRDAVTNAKVNGEKNIHFYNNDAGKFMDPDGIPECPR